MRIFKRSYKGPTYQERRAVVKRLRRQLVSVKYCLLNAISHSTKAKKKDVTHTGNWWKCEKLTIRNVFFQLQFDMFTSSDNVTLMLSHCEWGVGGGWSFQTQHDGIWLKNPPNVTIKLEVRSHWVR